MRWFAIRTWTVEQPKFTGDKRGRRQASRDNSWGIIIIKSPRIPQPRRIRVEWRVRFCMLTLLDMTSNLDAFLILYRCVTIKHRPSLAPWVITNFEPLKLWRKTYAQWLNTLSFLHLQCRISFLDQLTGKMPQFGASNKKLKVLNLSLNGFDGTIPHSFGDITEIEELIVVSQSTMLLSIPYN